MTRPSYRYTQTRVLAPLALPARRVLWVLLNPSEDPTLQRCIELSTRWEFTRLDVVCLFAVRAHSSDLRGYSDEVRVGPVNDLAISKLSLRADSVVLAWGGRATSYPVRIAQVCRLLRHHKPWCLGTTSTGQPVHPLMTGDTEVRPWSPLRMLGAA